MYDESIKTWTNPERKANNKQSWEKLKKKLFGGL
jgi:hypothetical protein